MTAIPLTARRRPLALNPAAIMDAVEIAMFFAVLTVILILACAIPDRPGARQFAIATVLTAALFITFVITLAS